jgi:hypothetical protein
LILDHAKERFLGDGFYPRHIQLPIYFLENLEDDIEIEQLQFYVSSGQGIALFLDGF